MSGIVDKHTAAAATLARDAKPVKYGEQEQKTNRDPEAGIDCGVVILPPVMGSTNPEAEQYPEDYVAYCQERMRAYLQEHGELPAWDMSGIEHHAEEQREADEQARGTL